MTISKVTHMTLLLLVTRIDIEIGVSTIISMSRRTTSFFKMVLCVFLTHDLSTSKHFITFHIRLFKTFEVIN